MILLLTVTSYMIDSPLVYRHSTHNRRWRNIGCISVVNQSVCLTIQALAIEMKPFTTEVTVDNLDKIMYRYVVASALH